MKVCSSVMRSWNGLLAHVFQNIPPPPLVFCYVSAHAIKLYAFQNAAVNFPWLELRTAFLKKEFTENQNINVIPKHLIPQSVPPGLKQSFTHDHLGFTERDSRARISRLILKRFPLTIECNYLNFVFLISCSHETGFQ